MRTKKLISFDFDDTLVKTPLPEEGKIVWKEKTGTDWPHRGWWSKPESLDMEIFDMSSAIEPVGITSITAFCRSDIFITAPLPN